MAVDFLWTGIFGAGLFPISGQRYAIPSAVMGRVENENKVFCHSEKKW
jgi:hypothetical protein